jgi:thioredoxin-like negative regulator of GroEL
MGETLTVGDGPGGRRTALSMLVRSARGSRDPFIGTAISPATRRARISQFFHLMIASLLFTLVASVSMPARADASEADRTVAAARDAAQHNRNAEAVVLFQWAIAQAPSRRLEWLRELAEQMTWCGQQNPRSGQAKAAIPLFREVLAAGKLSAQDTKWARLRLARALRLTHQFKASLRECDAVLAQDPKDLDARFERAETLDWEARNRDAAKEYEAILRVDPANRQARLNLAQEQDWRSRPQDAQRRLQAFLHDHPDDSDGVLLLAQFQNGMGRPDLAKQTFHDFLARHGTDPSGQQLLDKGKSLLDEIRLHEQPDVGVDYQQSTQSDHLRIGVTSFQQNTQLQEGRTTLGPRYQRYDYHPEKGQVPLTVDRPGVYARQRISERSELTGNFYLDLIEPRGGAKSRQALTYDTYYTLLPNDRLRFDLGSRRSTFDNITSLTRGITATYGTFSMDLFPDENKRTRLTTRADWGAYTDGNNRGLVQVEVERRVWPNPHLFLGARYTDFAFTKLLNDGYFNPKSYQSEVLTFHLWGQRGERLYYDFDGSYGREHANPGGGKPYSSLGGKLSYLLRQRLLLEGRWQFFSSRQGSSTGTGSELSSSGFARHTVGLFLRYVM